jgi:hypothetical protein
MKLEKPEWSVERIKRHLLFQSGSESGVFDQVRHAQQTLFIMALGKPCLYQRVYSPSANLVHNGPRQTLFVSTRVLTLPQYVTKTLEHVIIKSNKICTATGDVDEDKRKALMHSIETLIRWRTHVKDHKAAGKRKR